MGLMKVRFITGLSLLLMVAGLAFASNLASRPDNNDQPSPLTANGA